MPTRVGTSTPSHEHAIAHHALQAGGSTFTVNTVTDFQRLKLCNEKRVLDSWITFSYKVRTLYFSKHIKFSESDNFFCVNNYFEVP